MGTTTLLSSKAKRDLGSCSRTLVSRMKFFFKAWRLPEAWRRSRRDGDLSRRPAGQRAEARLAMPEPPGVAPATPRLTAGALVGSRRQPARPAPPARRDGRSWAD